MHSNTVLHALSACQSSIGLGRGQHSSFQHCIRIPLWQVSHQCEHTFCWVLFIKCRVWSALGGLVSGVNWQGGVGVGCALTTLKYVCDPP